MRFANQVAIVTGAGRGLGHAIALRLAGEGARVAVVSRTEQNAIRTAEEINAKYFGLAKPYAVDVAQGAAVKELGAQILADFTRVDILVNNAGLTRDGLVMRMSVSMNPGATALQVIPRLATSRAIDFVSPTSPALLAA